MLDLKFTVEMNSRFQSYGYEERGYYVEVTTFGESVFTSAQHFKYEKVIRALFESHEVTIKQFQYQGLVGRETQPNIYSTVPSVYGVHRFLVVVRQDGCD